jgi:hypothetical protein
VVSGWVASSDEGVVVEAVVLAQSGVTVENVRYAVVVVMATAWFEVLVCTVIDSGMSCVDDVANVDDEDIGENNDDNDNDTADVEVGEDDVAVDTEECGWGS